MTKPCIYPPITCGLEGVLRQGHTYHSGGSMEGGSVPGQSFGKASKRRGDGNLALKNGRISTGIPGRAGNKRVGGGKSKSNGTEVGKGR